MPTGPRVVRGTMFLIWAATTLFCSAPGRRAAWELPDQAEDQGVAPATGHATEHAGRPAVDRSLSRRDATALAYASSPLPASGLSSTTSLAGTSVATAVTEDVVGVAELARSAWRARDDERQLRSSIALWEMVVEREPSNAEAFVALARAYYFLADGFLSFEVGTTSAERDAYQKGATSGERALMVLDPAFEASMRRGDDFEGAIRHIAQAAIPAAYWYAVNVGRFASKRGLSSRLYYKGRVGAVMERILELEPTFFHGGADRYLGAFYAALPIIAGKDLERSRRHFDRSSQIAPAYLATKVAKAEFLAVELGDDAMYRRLLEEVLASPDTDDPDSAPENRAAKRAAQRMLARLQGARSSTVGSSQHDSGMPLARRERFARPASRLPILAPNE